MPLPQPTGGGGIAATPQEQNYADKLQAAYPGFYSKDGGPQEPIGLLYLNYMSKHPNANATAIYNNTVNGIKRFQLIPKAIQTSLGSVNTQIGKIVVGTEKGAESSLKTLDTLGGLNLGTLVLRAGEILLGLVLIGVAVAHLTGTDNALSNVAKKAGKLAVL